MDEKVEIRKEEQTMAAEVIRPPMLTISEYNKRCSMRSSGFKPGVACNSCGSEILIENPNIINRDPNGPRYVIVKCTNSKCRRVDKLFIRN